MSGLFGNILGGALPSFGGTPTHESPGAMEQRRYWVEHMSPLDPKSPAALELARGMAAVSQEELSRRLVAMAPGMANQCRPLTASEETTPTPPPTQGQPKRESP